MVDVRVYLMGAPRVEYGSDSVRLDTRKTLALLAYLCVTAGKNTRDSLAALFWPDSNQKQARALLRTAIYVLRKNLEGLPLDADRETVELTAGGSGMFGAIMPKLKNGTTASLMPARASSHRRWPLHIWALL